MTSKIQPTNSALPTLQPLLNLWSTVIEPHPSVNAVDERRKVRVLLGSTAVLSILLLCGIITVNVLMNGSSGSKPTYLAIAVGVFLLALPLYFLAKTPRYLLAAGLLVAFIATISCFFMLVTPGNTLFFYAIGLCLSVLVAGLYLPFRSVALSAIFTCVALVTVYYIHYPVVKTLLPTNPWIVDSLDSFASTATFMLLIAFNATLLLFFRLRDQIESDRQAEHERAVQQQQLAEDLRRTEQAKSAFLASMSHELRTPLNSILNFSEFVSTGLLGPVNTEQADALQKVIASGEHLLRLINDVLDITKIESGSLELFLEDVDMKGAIEAAIATGQGLLLDKPIELQAIVAPELPHIMGDRRRIHQILLNLISNAVKFTPSGSVVVGASLQAAAGEQEIMLSVKDSGMGIAAEDLDLIFQPFRQAKSGLRVQGGTGLGLPICRDLARAHGGRMWVESKVGVGSTFYVALPVRQAAPVMKPERD